ncbi:UNVERIFIED_CONTAM: hypothetical protein ABIC26_002715 [Paenibacillus sp. PvR008]
MTFTRWIEGNYGYSPTQLVYLHGNKYVRDLEGTYIEYCKESGIEPEID